VFRDKISVTSQIQQTKFPVNGARRAICKSAVLDDIPWRLDYTNDTLSA
jgi:hypothetical protein